jgi:hypothetical protein
MSSNNNWKQSEQWNITRRDGYKFSVLRNIKQMRKATGRANLLLSRFSKLLLVLASTAVLSFGPRRDPWPNFCFFQGRLCGGEWGLLFDEGRGWSFWVGCTFAALPTLLSLHIEYLILHGPHRKRRVHSTATVAHCIRCCGNMFT